MKNLMIHVSSTKEFKGEYRYAVRMQIHHSIKLGWERDDIILATNFPYEYKGIKSVLVSDDSFCKFHPRGSKINVILELMNRGYIDEELVWYHDLDAFQLRMLNPNMKNKSMAIVNYSSPRMRHGIEWNSGSFFFNIFALPIFNSIREKLYEIKTDEEHAMLESGMDKECIKLDHSYNYGYTGFMNTKCYKPIKVAHFHPMKKRHMNYFKPLITERLKKTFKQHGLKI